MGIKLSYTNPFNNRTSPGMSPHSAMQNEIQSLADARDVMGRLVTLLVNRELISGPELALVLGSGWSFVGTGGGDGSKAP